MDELIAIQSSLTKDNVYFILEPYTSSSNNRGFKLKRNVEIAFYCSQAPCGDASMKCLAENNLKNFQTETPSISEADESNNHDRKRLKFFQPILGRGRQDFSQLGICRSKPGRGDAISTQSMSCR